MSFVSLAARVTIVAIALLATTQVAHAAPPQVFVIPVDRTVIDEGLCGFPLEVRDVGTFRIAFHFDEAGEIQWVNVTSFRYRITVRDPETGVALWTPSPEHIIETAYDTTNSGLVARFVLPGAGLLSMDAGRVVFDNDGEVTITGPHMLLEGDLAALCAAFAAG